MPGSVQFSSVAQSCPTLCDPKDCSMPGLPVHHQLPEFTKTHVRWVGDATQPSHPPSSPSPPAFSLSQHQGLFQWVSVLWIRWSKYWSFSFSISPSNEHPGLISFRMDWLDLLAVQGTLKSLLQHHSSKASILEFSFLEKSVNHFKTWDVFKIPSQHITDQRCINTSFVTQMLLLGDLPICFWRLIWLTSLCKVVRA